MSSLLLLAAATPGAGTVDESEVSAGPIGLLIVLIMLIVTALLIRNMNGRLKRLPREFPSREDQADDRADDARARRGEQPGG